MKNFSVTQKILSLGATYLAKYEGEETVAYTVKGKVLTFAPKLEMKRGEGEEIIRTMKGNLFSTKFTITDNAGSEQGIIQFPFFSFLAKFTLIVGEKSYQAKGGFTARKFTCSDESGQTVFSISKELAFRDKFAVSVSGDIPEETAILAAVAIDQRFFQKKD